MRHSNDPVAARQAACYERLRSTLLAESFRDRWPRPLVHWALPSDRRLPQVLLGRRLEEVLALSFEELAAIRSIGPTKIESLFVLLSRAAAAEAPGAELFQSHRAHRLPANSRKGLDRNAATDWREASAASAPAPDEAGPFEPAWVSEALWQQWQADVAASGAADLAVGHVLPALEDVPTVVWPTPLANYAGKPLADIRAMRTHGAKRVAIIMRAYHLVQSAYRAHRKPAAVRAALAPALVAAIDRWVAVQSASTGLLTRADVVENFADRVIAQLALDCGGHVAQLARQRLGIDGPPHSVRGQARRLGITRARVYQLYERCSQVMHVRWPGGREALAALERSLAIRGGEPAAIAIFRATAELCYPQRLEASDPVTPRRR